MRPPISSLLAAALVVTASQTRAGEPPQPVLAYAFTEQLDRLVRDASGEGHHGIVSGDAQYTEGPTGPALVFDGGTVVQIRAGEPLVVSDGLTLDIWLRWDGEGARGEVLHTSGDRFRLAVDAEGGLHFGLKTDDERGDLSAGPLVAGTWHRVTATFARPRMAVYVDETLSAERSWDHAIGPISALRLGAKDGREHFFRGAIDQVRIYPAARAPLSDDGNRVFAGGNRGSARLDIRDIDGRVVVDTGALRLELDRRTGALRSLDAAGKSLIAENGEPPLFATLMESRGYDGTVDVVERRMIVADYHCESVVTSVEDEAFSAEIRAVLAFPDDDRIDAVLGLRARKGSPVLQVTLRLHPHGEFRDRFLREAGLRQPLALHRRKRVVQPADQGIRWDTRHRYEFHMHVDFATTPEFNIWRHFHIDQASPHAYAIWRAESLGTAGLHAFRGRRAPGWMTLYDEQGGALLGYRGFADRAPKSLYANADGGGEARVYLHPPTQPALDPRDPRLSAGVFGVDHEIDWIFFAGEEAFVQPERELARIWGVEGFESDGPPRLAPAADEIDLWSSPSPGGADIPLVAGSVPLPRGAMVDASHARLFVRGAESPAQARAIAFWPDRSIKWLLLVFPLDGDGGYRFGNGEGEGDEVSFHVTQRDGETVPALLRYGPDVRAGRIESDLLVRTDERERVHIGTGPLALVLAPGDQWIDTATLNGREMIRADGRPQAFVDYLRTDKLYPVGTTHPEGNLDPGPVRIDRIDIEEEGPLRTVVRLEGRAMAAEPAPVILRIEAYAGKPYVRIFHSVIFEHMDPRLAFVRRMGLRFALASDGELRPDAGVQGGPATLDAAPLTGLRQDSHLNYELWQRLPGARHRTLRDSAHHSRGWLGAMDDSGGVAVAVRDMWQDFPKELRVHSETPVVEIDLWPESVPLMDVRRYSNYPHRAQGESVSWNPEWVLRTYYGDLTEEMAALAEARRVKPWSGWEFRTDPDDTGLALGWHRGEDPDEWRPIRVPDWWQNVDTEAANYLGHAWYRTAFEVPEDLEGKDLELVLEGVDEQGWVYVNGEWVGEQSVESTGESAGALWERPFSVRVPADRLRPGAENLLAIRVHAHAGHGGLHKPVYVSVPNDEPPTAPASRAADRQPFAGTSRTHEMLLLFRAPGHTAEHVDALVADFQSRPLVYAGWENYAAAEVTMPLADPADPAFLRFHQNMNNVASWWLLHQKAYGWYGMWDHGDVQHRYRAGYGRIFPPDELARILELPLAERGRINLRDYRQILDYVPQNDWAFDNGRWGWGNTEGLPNYTMSLMYLLTGRRDLFFFVEANARHSRDVVARHSGVWFGRGTRHGVQHWSCGNHEERQTTFTEQRYHYLLTGEHRTREWNRTISDGHYLTTICPNHAAHSGRSYGLLFRWELTGDPELGEIMRRYMHALAQPEGLAVSTRVRFPEAEIDGEPDGLHGTTMFFHTFGAMHAVLDYYYLTGDERVRDAIIRTADHAVQNLRRGDPGTMRKVIAFAARHAQDGDRYAAVLRDWTDGPGLRHVLQQVPANPDHWYGENSFLVGNVSGGLFWYMDASYVLGVLGREPGPTERQEAEMAEIEARPILPRARIPRESWQSEYDRPEFAEYFRNPMTGRLPE